MDNFSFEIFHPQKITKKSANVTTGCVETGNHNPKGCEQHSFISFLFRQWAEWNVNVDEKKPKIRRNVCCCLFQHIVSFFNFVKKFIGRLFSQKSLIKKFPCEISGQDCVICLEGVCILLGAPISVAAQNQCFLFLCIKKNLILSKKVYHC